jgi:hypothetical protein
MQDLIDFLSPVNMQQTINDQVFTEGQFAKHISIHENEIPDIEHADIVLLGIGESRGLGINHTNHDAPDKIRKQLY